MHLPMSQCPRRDKLIVDDEFRIRRGCWCSWGEGLAYVRSR